MNTHEEILERLEKLRQKRLTFEEYGEVVPPKLVAEIAAAERLRDDEQLLSALADGASLHLPVGDVKSTVVVAMEYADGILRRVGVGHDAALLDQCAAVREVAAGGNDGDESDDDPANPSGDRPAGKRWQRRYFNVHFADGKSITGLVGKKTMIEALRYMSLSRVAAKTDIRVSGYSLVSREQRPGGTRRSQWQSLVDGWWVYTNISNEVKADCIRTAGEKLGMPLTIEWREAMPELPFDQEQQPQQPQKAKGKRALYSLNGGIPESKNRSVLNAVRQFMREIPNATFSEVEQSFPKHLQGSYGVVVSLTDLEQRKQRNASEMRRWFLADDEILTAADGVRFAVSTQWSDTNFPSFQRHVEEEFDWTLQEA